MSNEQRQLQLSIWRYGDAPAEYEKLSAHGGDEDWVVHCPKEMRDYYLPGGLEFAINGEEKSYLNGWGHVDMHELDNGDVVVIFAHA